MTRIKNVPTNSINSQENLLRVIPLFSTHPPFTPLPLLVTSISLPYPAYRKNVGPLAPQQNKGLPSLVPRPLRHQNLGRPRTQGGPRGPHRRCPTPGRVAEGSHCWELRTASIRTPRPQGWEGTTPMNYC